MAAGVVPQSSWSLKPSRAPRSLLHSAVLTVLPLPRNRAMFGGQNPASHHAAQVPGAGVTVVALVPSAGPVPPPMIVVMPPPSAPRP